MRAQLVREKDAMQAFLSIQGVFPHHLSCDHSCCTPLFPALLHSCFTCNNYMGQRGSLLVALSLPCPMPLDFFFLLLPPEYVF